VFGSSLMRLESSGEFTPATARAGESTAAQSRTAREAARRLNENEKGELETKVLETIRQEAADLSAECRAADSRRPRSASAAAGLFPDVSLHDSDCEILDVDPMSIDEYMNRLHERNQRAASKNRPGSTDRQGPAARRAATPIFPVEPLPGEEARTEEALTSEPSPSDVPMAMTPSNPVAEEEPIAEFEIARVAGSSEQSAEARSADRKPGDTRANRDNLREIVIESTRSTLVQYIRRRHQLVIIRKLLLIFMALGLASCLYAAHYLYGVPPRYLAWGATAIGLVGLLGMVQLWSRAARQQARLSVRVSYAQRKSTAAKGKAGKLPSVANRPPIA
jgi:hypothetical protein